MLVRVNSFRATLPRSWAAATNTLATTRMPRDHPRTMATDPRTGRVEIRNAPATLTAIAIQCARVRSSSRNTIAMMATYTGEVAITGSTLETSCLLITWNMRTRETPQRRPEA